MKKLLRDIPLGLFLILGMSLIFFLLFNGISIAQVIKDERDVDKKNSYKFSKEVGISLDYELFVNKEKNFDGNAIAINSDFKSDKHIKEMFEICKQYDGNVFYCASFWCDFDSTVQMNLYLHVGQKFDIVTTDSKTHYIESLEDLEDGVYVAQANEFMCDENNGKKTVFVENTMMNVLGIRKDYTFDMSDNPFIGSYSVLSKEQIASMYDLATINLTDYGEEYFVFQSDNECDFESYENVISKLKKKGYIVSEKVFNEKSSYEENNIKEYSGFIYKDIIGQIIIGLSLFGLINCIFISRLWMKRRKTELTIRKAFGQSSVRILCLIVKELLKFELIALGIAYIMQMIYKSVNTKSGFYINPSIYNGIIICGIMFFLILVIAIASLIEVLKTKPATGIKEV